MKLSIQSLDLGGFILIKERGILRTIYFQHVCMYNPQVHIHYLCLLSLG